MDYVIFMLLLAVSLTNANRIYGNPDEDIVKLEKRQDECWCVCPCPKTFVISNGTSKSLDKGKIIKSKKAYDEGNGRTAEERLYEMIRLIKPFGYEHFNIE